MSKKLNLTMALAGMVALASTGITMSLTSGSLAKSNTNLAVEETTDEDKVSTVLDETVYVFAEINGKTRRVISSNWTKTALDTDKYTKVEKDDKSTPVTLDIRYTLDDKEISAKDLMGKSGKVTIEYNYNNNQKSGNYYVPYAVMTGMLLDNDVFTNVSVEGGKLFNDGARTVVAGISLPGMQENLGIASGSFTIPNGLKITADAKNFKLGMTMSVATAELFSGLDTSKLNTIDELAGQINQLTDGMKQLMTGSGKIYDGLATLNDKSGTLAEGVRKLANGSAELANGLEEIDDGVGVLENGIAKLASGLTQLANNSAALNTGVNGLLTNYSGTLNQSITALDGTLTALNTAISLIPNDAAYAEAKANLTAQATYLAGVKANLATGSETLSGNIAGLLESLGTYTGSVGQTSTSVNESLAPGITNLKTGTEQLSNGANSLADGLAELDGNVPALVSGVSQLKNGTGELKDGITRLNNEGIQKIVEMYGGVENWSTRVKDIINLAKNTRKTKYIFRTDEIN